MIQFNICVCFWTFYWMVHTLEFNKGEGIRQSSLPRLSQLATSVAKALHEGATFGCLRPCGFHPAGWQHN